MTAAGLIRCFPRETEATPTDPQAFVGAPPLWIEASDVREVHVSCTFTWDRPEAERIATQCRFRFPQATVLVGGPAYGDPGRDFEPGMYLRTGYVITSRGCPNRCPRCKVPEREGYVRTLPIRDGYDLVDNNLLACPPDHIDAVLAMLARQPQRPRFTGGLEAARFTPEIATKILRLRPAVMFFAFDRPAEQDAVARAFELVYKLTSWSKGTFRHYVGCYALCGYEGDTPWAATDRIAWLIQTGARAYPMYWRDDNYSTMPREWRRVVGGTISMGGRR